MHALLTLLGLAILISARFVQCSNNCYDLNNALHEIHDLLIEESEEHNYEMFRYGGSTYVSRTRYILKKLNAEIRKAQQNNNNNKYNYNQRGSDKPANSCKQLEDEILTKSKELGIQKVGLEDNLTRLKKVLQYQDDRKSFYLKEIEECKQREDLCEVNKTELEAKLNTLHENRIHLEETIKKLNDTINTLEIENKKLQTKLNNNAPAIHGGTGVEYPNIPTQMSKTTSTTTTERIATVQNTTSIANTDDSNQITVIPDIDLRNDASDMNVQP